MNKVIIPWAGAAVLLRDAMRLVDGVYACVLRGTDVARMCVGCPRDAPQPPTLAV